MSKVFINKKVHSVIGDIGQTNVEIFFEDGNYVLFTHEQDCCEHVELVDVGGSLDLNSRFRQRELISIEKKSVTTEVDEDGNEKKTTIYELQFDNGFMQLEFCGTSNGYYRTDVDVFYIMRLF